MKMVRLLGAGAFSEVYLVKDGEGRHYACKISGHAELLEREAACHRRICHPLFPKFIDFWKQGGKAYLLMEYIGGENLKKTMEVRGGFAARQTAAQGCRQRMHRLPRQQGAAENRHRAAKKQQRIAPGAVPPGKQVVHPDIQQPGQQVPLHHPAGHPGQAPGGPLRHRQPV